jgi:hypothetical protein
MGMYCYYCLEKFKPSRNQLWSATNSKPVFCSNNCVIKYRTDRGWFYYNKDFNKRGRGSVSRAHRRIIKKPRKELKENEYSA